MKKIVSVLLVAVLAAMLVACAAPAPAPTQAPAEQPAQSAIKMAMTTDVGGVNDESFNMLAWQGHQKATSELGIETWYVEAHQEADYAVNLETLYDAGAQLIWGIGFMMADAVKDAATKNPDATYAIIDQSYDTATMPKNLVGITFKEQEPSFLVGYIAGKMTKTNKVGFVGGMVSDVIGRFHYGYIAGVKYANPDAEILVQYADSFSDAALGKSIAQKMYLDGADIVFHAAGAVGNGVIEAAKETGAPASGGKWAIGVDTDQNHLAPDNVLTSSCKGVDTAILLVAKAFKDGTLKGGTNLSFGLAEDGVGIAPTSNKNVPADILAEVDALIAKIKAGELVIPGTEAEATAFIDAL